jgi:hypothetical protein
MRIAVCLSGQPRAIEFAAAGILNYFSQKRTGHIFEFFCHAWNYNTWKLQNLQTEEKEIVDFDWLRNQLDRFSPIYSKINVEESAYQTTKGDRIPYGSLLYSAMIANHLKRKYEIENNFRYDLVYKARYDSVFNPQTIPDPIIESHPRFMFSRHFGRMPLEYNRFNFSDVLYYGDSWSMDIAADLYRYVIQEINDFRRDDDHDCFGPGTLMTDYAYKHSIKLDADPNLEETIYRKEVLGLSPIANYVTIQHMHRSFYTKNAI